MSSSALEISILRLSFYCQVHKEVGVERRAYWCIKEWDSSTMTRAYEIGMLLLVFVFPFTIITFAYANICMELWIMTSRRAAMRADR